MHREVCAASLIAAFGMARKSPTYTTNKNREEIKRFLRAELFDLLNKYEDKIEEKEHIKNIVIFQEKLSERYKDSFVGGNIGFGRAQKLINLYLKYAWACGFIYEPPHCPLDSIVVAKLKALGQDLSAVPSSWIRYKQEDYEIVIEKIKNVIGEHSIASWELTAFNERV